MSFRKTIQYLFTLWLTVIMAVTVSVLADSYGPRLEGQHFPVITRASLVQVEEVTPHLTRVWLRSTKLRDCPYDDIHWWFGEQPPGKSTPVSVVFEDGPVVRPPGEMLIGPWLVSMTKEQLEERSYAYVTHNCHILWATESLFYASENH